MSLERACVLCFLMTRIEKGSPYMCLHMRRRTAVLVCLVYVYRNYDIYRRYPESVFDNVLKVIDMILLDSGGARFLKNSRFHNSKKSDFLALCCEVLTHVCVWGKPGSQCVYKDAVSIISCAMLKYLSSSTLQVNSSNYCCQGQQQHQLCGQAARRPGGSRWDGVPCKG
jgi:hypothetical protein